MNELYQNELCQIELCKRRGEEERMRKGAGWPSVRIRTPHDMKIWGKP